MGHCFQSPLRRWDVLAGLCESIGAETFVEVGCKDGKTTGTLLKALPDLEVHAIDPWEPVPNSDEDYSGWDFTRIEAEFYKNVREHEERVFVFKNTSMRAAELYAEKCKHGERRLADVVFIDAGHDYENALADIRLWWPLVREGGYLCGHDYQHKFPGVMRAVAECFPLMRVAVCPDSVWVVRKDEGLLRAAA